MTSIEDELALNEALDLVQQMELNLIHTKIQYFMLLLEWTSKHPTDAIYDITSDSMVTLASQLRNNARQLAIFTDRLKKLEEQQ